MGESSSTPRFRIRLEDGAELPISSVEALARRVARGDLEPETPLYDGSTGAWIESSKASVVQFILDEMRRDGVELPPGWDTPPEVESPMGVPGEVSPNISSASEKSGGPESAESADAGSVGSPPDGEPDPLELGLTLTPPGDVALVDEEVGAPKRTVPDRKPDQSRVATNDPPVVEDSPAGKDWMTPRSAGGLFTPTVGEEEVGVGGERSGSRQHPSSVGARRHWAIRRAPKEWQWVAALLLLGIALVGAGILLGDGQRGEQGATGIDGSGDDAGAQLAAAFGASSLPIPIGLEGAAQRSAELVVQRYQAAADSIRADQALSRAPPGPWLSGFYMANAAEFDEVPEYWNAYARLVEGLRLLDRALFLDVLSRDLGPSVVPPEQLQDLEVYLRDRYAATLGARQELYDQLGSVADAALGLHGFLVERSADIQYTPALGTPAVARDPVLEIGTEDPGVRSQLEGRLDDLFQALDRSRGGGAPSLSGLRAELFGGFAPF